MQKKLEYPPWEKVLGKTAKMGKFGKISLMYDLMKSFLLCNMDRIYLQLKNTCFDSRPSSFKSSTC